jgi:adenylate cyclase class IV
MTTDSGSPPGRDWTEREARFVIENDEYLRIRDALDDDRKIGSYGLGRSKVKQHDDTYFDTKDYGLHELGWSLRIRRSERGTWVTLKIPDPGGESEGSGGTWHREIENTGHEDFVQVFERIVELLQRQHILRGGSWERDRVLDLALWQGARCALESAGLRDLFTVSTLRHAWPVMEASHEIAELTLDDSTYLFQQVRRDDSERQCRMEVELTASARDEHLGDISELVQRNFGIEEVRISKFEHGMILYRMRKLGEKFEVKIAIPQRSVHEEIARKIRSNPEFVQGYLFTSDGKHRLRDAYFDTPRQHLFAAGCYLRLRKDGDERDLKFRILHFSPNLGQAVQYEVAAKGGESDFSDHWDQIQGWLSSISGVKTPKRRPGSLERIEKVLSDIGLRPALEVEVDRVGWSVLKGGARGELIARLKYDKITFRAPGDKRSEVGVEFEVAGAEDHEAAPRALRSGEYYTFLRAFTDQCRESARMSKIGWEINAKYFAGMIKLGLQHEIPDWYGTLRIQASMPLRREVPAGGPEFDESDNDEQSLVPEDDELRGGALARNGETNPSGNLPDGPGRNFTVNIPISMSQAQSAQMNVNFGPYGQALLGELDKVYAHVQSVAPESAPAIHAAREAVLAGDASALMTRIRSLGARFWDIAQQVSIPVLTLFIENRLKLHL